MTQSHYSNKTDTDIVVYFLLVLLLFILFNVAVICNYVVINLLSLYIIKYNNPCNYLDFKYRRIFKHSQHFLQTLLEYNQQSYLRQAQPFT